MVNNKENQETQSDLIDKWKNRKEDYLFMLTITRDGGNESNGSIYQYNSAIDAVAGYMEYKDWGQAKDYLTVRLYEPNGEMTEKILSRPPAGENVFVREQYIKAEVALLNVKDYLDPTIYSDLVHEFAKIFGKDSRRFDDKRFFELTESEKVND